MLHRGKVLRKRDLMKEREEGKMAGRKDNSMKGGGRHRLWAKAQPWASMFGVIAVVWGLSSHEWDLKRFPCRL